MANRLSREKSPYLLQHAHNPVDWYPWGKEAFAKALKEDRPVFLSIGYSTCHWCHVMEHESFEDADTAKILNELFVPVKVDREERPDIDSVYMSYVQAMTGSGGWPMSVFLTPEKKPFYGGTYFPPKDRWGMPGFSTLLRSISNSWKTHRKEILESADSAVQFLAGPPAPAEPAALDIPVLEDAFKRFASGFDETYAGFGRAPKFPRSHALSFLLRWWLRSKEPQALAIVERTLEAMACGGIYDQLGGGFHRYSVDARWRIPHFEKMLYDQALLVQTYLEACQASGKPLYARIVRETADYVLSRMTSPEGGFYSAEDADSPDPKEPSKKREGAYFLWEKEELDRRLGADSSEFCAYYGVEPGGNALSDPHDEFEKQNALYVADPSKPPSMAVQKARGTLLAVREKRPRPHLDDKVLADWNGMMIAALARASIVLSEPRYLGAAQKAARFIETKMEKGPAGLLHRWRDGEAAIPAHLNDYAFLLEAHLELYEASFDPRELSRARFLAERMEKLFWDGAGGGFYLTASDAEVLISRPKEIYDGAIPSGNSAAARGLARLAQFTGEERWAGLARRTAEAFSDSIAADPSNHPLMLQALDFLIGPARRIEVEAPDAKTASLFAAAARKGGFAPNQVFLVKQADKARAMVCEGSTCKPPVTSPEELERILK